MLLILKASVVLRPLMLQRDKGHCRPSQERAELNLPRPDFSRLVGTCGSLFSGVKIMSKIDNLRKCPRLGNLLIQGPLQSPDAGEFPAFPGDFCARQGKN